MGMLLEFIAETLKPIFGGVKWLSKKMECIWACHQQWLNYSAF